MLEWNGKKRIVLLAHDLIGFEKVDEIAEATELSIEEVEEILDEE